MAYVGAQDHGVLGDTGLDDFKGLPDVPVGAGDRPDVECTHCLRLYDTDCLLEIHHDGIDCL